MGSVKRFAAINTKIRALEGQLLNNADYDALLDMSNLGEMVSYLKKRTTYEEDLEAVEPEN
ncbi:ATPase, V0 complex, c/d subunit like protein, partial [Aduncisulcus paluster]